MSGGAYRRHMRATVAAALDTLPRMSGVAARGILSPSPDLSMIPERMIATMAERPRVAAAGGAVDRELQLSVVIRRKGEDAQDQLDLDQDQIEPTVIAVLEMGSTTCALTDVRFDYAGEGVTPLAQMTLSFAVVRYD